MKPLTRRAAIGGIAPLLLPGFASRSAAAAQIRILCVPNENGLLAVFADQEGFLRKSGVDAKVDVLANGAAVLSAVVGGSAEIGVTNPVTLALAHTRGVPITCFAGTSLYTSKAPTTFLVVTKGSPLRTAADLTGKTIAVVQLRDTTYLTVEYWLDKNGGDSTAVKFVEMHFGEMPEALARGRVDAAFCAEPTLSTAGDAIRILADTYAAVAPQFLTGVHITTRAFAQANPDVVRRVGAALHDTALWANGHHLESGAILAKFAKIDPAVVRTMRRSTYADHVEARYLQPPIDVAARYKEIPSSFPAQEIIWSG